LSELNLEVDGTEAAMVIATGHANIWQLRDARWYAFNRVSEGLGAVGLVSGDVHFALPVEQDDVGGDLVERIEA